MESGVEASDLRDTGHGVEARLNGIDVVRHMEGSERDESVKVVKVFWVEQERF